MAYYHPYITGKYNPPYTLNNQVFLHCSHYYHSDFRNLQINCPPRNASAFFSVLFLTESPPTPNQTCHLCPSFLPLGFFSPAWNPLPNHLSATSASSASWPQRGVRISWWCTLPTNQRNDNRKTTIKWRKWVDPCISYSKIRRFSRLSCFLFFQEALWILAAWEKRSAENGSQKPLFQTMLPYKVGAQ